MNQKGHAKAGPLQIWLLKIYSSEVSSSDVSTVSSSGASASSSASSEDFRLEGAETLAITKSLSIVGFAPSGMLTLEIVMTSPTSNPVKSTVIKDMKPFWADQFGNPHSSEHYVGLLANQHIVNA